MTPLCRMCVLINCSFEFSSNVPKESVIFWTSLWWIIKDTGLLLILHKRYMKKWKIYIGTFVLCSGLQIYFIKQKDIWFFTKITYEISLKHSKYRYHKPVIINLVIQIIQLYKFYLAYSYYVKACQMAKIYSKQFVEIHQKMSFCEK